MRSRGWAAATTPRTAIPPGTPHMRGTTSALRILFGKGLGTDHADEFVHPTRGRRFHVFDGFALVNLLLCSAGPDGSSQGRPTSTMFANCASHFTATLRILEPTVVVLQGVKVAQWAHRVLRPTAAITDHLHETHQDDRRILMCSFSHPSSRGATRWGDRIDQPYLEAVVAPTLNEVRSRL